MVRSSSLALLVLALSACRAAIPPWGTTIDAAKRNADNALTAFAYRFHHVQRDAKFAAARPRMARYALIPSKIVNDTSIWSSRASDSTRALSLWGSHTAGGYTFTTRPNAPYPTRVGDQRHVMQLRALGDDSFEWMTMVDHAIGPVRADQVAGALGTLFTAFDGKRDAELLADAQSTFPRTARHLGQLFNLDSLRSAPQADGTTTFAMYVAYSPGELRKGYPAFTDYIQKYITPSVYRVQLTDRQGATYFDLAQRDARFVVRLRAKNGELVSLTGAPRPMPDSMLVKVDFSAKFKIFRVGFTNLVGDFTIERGEDDRAWMMRFRKEPAWHFPLAVDKLIQTPLRRPFEGRGSEVRMAVRDNGNTAVSARSARTVVRESAIMRWLGGLGSTAFGDYSGSSEAEENRFTQELFGALRQDIAAYSR